MQSLLPLGNVKQGIPSLLNPALDMANIVSLAYSDAQIFKRMAIGQKPLDPTLVTPSANLVIWGIYDTYTFGAERVIVPDSIIAVDVKKEYNLPNYPMEDGAFQSYNKVKEPYDIRIKMAIGGDAAKLTDFLKVLDGIVASINLYEVVTPDATYVNANIHHYDFQRTATNGVGLLTVTVWAKEIRSDIIVAFANVKVPDAVKPAKTTTTATPSAPVPPAAATKLPLTAAQKQAVALGQYYRLP